MHISDYEPRLRNRQNAACFVISTEGRNLKIFFIFLVVLLLEMTEVNSQDKDGDCEIWCNVFPNRKLYYLKHSAVCRIPCICHPAR